MGSPEKESHCQYFVLSPEVEHREVRKVDENTDLNVARTVVKISKVKTKAPLSAKKPVVTTVRPSTPTRGRPNLRPSAEAKTPGPLTARSPVTPKTEPPVRAPLTARTPTASRTPKVQSPREKCLEEDDLTASVCSGHFSIYSEASGHSRLTQLSRKSFSKRILSSKEIEEMQVMEKRRELTAMMRRNQLNCRKALHGTDLSGAGRKQSNAKLTEPKERSRFRLAMTSRDALASAEHHVLALVVHGTPLARHHLVRQALSPESLGASKHRRQRQMVHSSSPLYLARCMDRILQKVAVSGTLCHHGGTVVSYSGQLRQLFEDGELEIELRAKTEILTECGEDVADVLRIVASWNFEDDQILAWKEDTGMGINDWVGYLDIMGCQLTLRNELGSDIVLKFLEPHQAAPRLSSWLEDFFNFPEAALEAPCCAPVFLALGRMGH